jgi:hypothetical protein
VLALFLAVLLAGCWVPDVEYYDAAIGGETAGDTGAADRTTTDRDSGRDVANEVDASVGEAESDALADGGAEADSSDASAVSTDASMDPDSDAADASATSDSPDTSLPDPSDAADAPAGDENATDAPAEAVADGPAEAATDAPEEPADDGPAEADGSSGNTCPSPTPPGATRCCGTTPCVERQGNACNCGLCIRLHCSGMCCTDSQGNLSCVATPADCQ